jgi:hypothetical protein
MVTAIRGRMNAAFNRALYSGATAALPPSVRVDGSALVDDHSGCTYPMNAAALAVLTQLERGETVGSVIGAHAAAFPGHDIEHDYYRLVHTLNYGGLLNVMRPRHRQDWGWRSFLAAPMLTGSLLLQRFTSTLAPRRQTYAVPGQLATLAGAMLRCLMPWASLVICLIAALLAIGVASIRESTSIVAGLGLLLISQVVHEIAHVLVLGHTTATLLTSPAAFKVLMPEVRSDRAVPAAIAGPLAGALVCAMGLVTPPWSSAAAATGILGSIGIACHLACLTPWAGDGRTLIRSAATPRTTVTRRKVS